MVLILFFSIFFLTLIVRAPIFFSLALSGIALLWNKGMLSPQLVVQRMFPGMDSFPMMAIPFFMLAGSLMDTGGISGRLVRFSNYLVGWIQGGLRTWPSWPRSPLSAASSMRTTDTYIEPRNFDIMLGVHSLAYGLIGGLGIAAGPLLGVLIDIGLLESTRVFQGWRMVVFGGLVAVLLIVRPRGLLDEVVVNRVKRALSRH